MLTFNSIKELKSYTAAMPDRVTEESLATVDNVVYKYVNGSWAPLKINSSEGLTMSLYDFNKMTLEGLPVLSAADACAQLQSAIDKIFPSWSYLLLMCKELSYITIFQHISPFSDYQTLSDAIVDLIHNIKSVETNEDGTIDIWAVFDEEIHMYKLFNADGFIVTTGG